MFFCRGILFNHESLEIWIRQEKLYSVASLRVDYKELRLGNLDAKEIGDMQKTTLKQCG